MASLYSKSHRNMSLSEEFPGGITNGALWYDTVIIHILFHGTSLISLLFTFRYPIYGGMQDWNYIHAGCFELTLEISDDKWPHASEVKFDQSIFTCTI